MEDARGKSMVQVQQNELDLMDLMDLFKILYKNRFMIVLVTIIVTLASLGGALYIRSLTPKITAVDFRSYKWAEDNNAVKAGILTEIFDEDQLFRRNDIVNEFFKLKGIKSEFQKSGAEDNLEKRRVFLKRMIETKKIYGGEKLDTLRYTILYSKTSSYKLNEEVLRTYLTIVNNEKSKSIKKIIDERLIKTENLYNTTLNKLREKDSKLSENISKELIEMLSSNASSEILNLKYAKDISEQLKFKELYEEVADKYMGLKGLKEDPRVDNQIIQISSYYEIQRKSKAKLIVAIGVVMGVILGMTMAFMKEFWKHFKEEIK